MDLSKNYWEVFVMSTKKIASIAMLTALSVLFNIFSFNTGTKYFQISLIYIPSFIAGGFFGPISGFAVGFLGDLVGGFIHPLGPYNPLIGLASGVMGLIPGLVFKYLKVNDYIKLAISFVLCLIICTSGLNTLAFYLYYSKGKTYWALLTARLAVQTPVTALNALILMLSWKPLAVLVNKYLIEQKPDRVSEPTPEDN